VTDEDYIYFVMRMATQGEFLPVPKTVLEAFRRWPTWFIGYSLRDGLTPTQYVEVRRRFLREHPGHVLGRCRPIDFLQERQLTKR
jgi:hypothetical protein